MKKILLLATAILLSLALTSCFGSPEPETLVFSENSTGTGYTVSCGVAPDVIRIDIPEYHNGKPVRTVYADNFASAYSMIEITIPGTVTDIFGSFEGCRELVSITVDPDNSDYTSIDGNLYTKDGSTLLRYAPGKSELTFEVPESVVSIGPYAFADAPLHQITLHDDIAELGAGAFAGCKNIQRISLPEDLECIADSLFEYCSGLDEISLPRSVTEIGNRAFYACTDLGNVAFPKDIESIGDSAFEKCSSITELILPNGVTVGTAAFSGCGIINASLPAEALACLSGTAVERIIVTGGESIPKNALEGVTTLRAVELPKGLLSIGERAFADCTALDRVTVPATVTEIGAAAFLGCSALEALILADADGWYENGETPAGIPSDGNVAPLLKVSKSAFKKKQ